MLRDWESSDSQIPSVPNIAVVHQMLENQTHRREVDPSVAGLEP